jgi:hypothetical protein
MCVAANVHFTREQGETTTPPLVALPRRYRYILRRDRVPLHPTLQPNPRQGSARRRRLGARSEVRWLSPPSPQGWPTLRTVRQIKSCSNRATTSACCAGF